MNSSTATPLYELSLFLYRLQCDGNNKDDYYKHICRPVYYDYYYDDYYEDDYYEDDYEEEDEVGLQTFKNSFFVIQRDS